jgi:hypothetical protein
MANDDLLDISKISNSIKSKVVEVVAEEIQKDLKREATKHARTGALSNILILEKSNKGAMKVLGERRTGTIQVNGKNYSVTSYHAMYFLVEKAGENAVKRALKKGQKALKSI